jgi:hypothetical protein
VSPFPTRIIQSCHFDDINHGRGDLTHSCIRMEYASVNTCLGYVQTESVSWCHGTKDDSAWHGLDR